MKIWLLFLLLFTTNLCFSQKQSKLYDSIAATFDLLNNMPFKELYLEDTSGHFYNTSSLYGKTIYVDFWFTSCPPCIKEIPYSTSLQQFFVADTNIVFLSICIDNVDRKPAWKQMIHDRQMSGIHLFYERNRPQKINLLREYEITFPTYLLVNKEMKIIGYNAPRPSEEGWIQWAIVQSENNVFLSESYKQFIYQSKRYREYINENWAKIVALRK